MPDKAPLVLEDGQVRQAAAGDVITCPDIRDSALTAGRVPYVAVAGQFADSPNMMFDGTMLTLVGADFGFSQSQANNTAILTGFYFPASADKQHGWLFDYQDTAYFATKRGAGLTIDPPPTAAGWGNECVFADDTTYIQWTGTSPGTITLTVDFTGFSTGHLTHCNSPYWAVGLTFRFGTAPTHIQVESWNSATETYVTRYDQDVSVSTSTWAWVSPTYAESVE
ncbi:MAG: hypothetical protein PHR35_20420, partial [Kiritimatiellae bacterium]|nr:hypothetical protein [Kiritimatiellia bacterium]